MPYVKRTLKKAMKEKMVVISPYEFTVFKYCVCGITSKKLINLPSIELRP